MQDKVIIIGTGPAGVAAAIQLKRQSIPFEIIEKDKVGGLLHNANRIENYPGFPNGISGPELVHRFQEHLEQWDIQVQYETVINIRWEEDSFHIQTQRSSFSSSILIIASGTQPKTVSDIQISDTPIELRHKSFISKDLSRSRRRKTLLSRKKDHPSPCGLAGVGFFLILYLKKISKIPRSHALRGNAYGTLPRPVKVATRLEYISFPPLRGSLYLDALRRLHGTQSVQ